MQSWLTIIESGIIQFEKHATFYLQELKDYQKKVGVSTKMKNDLAVYS